MTDTATIEDTQEQDYSTDTQEPEISDNSDQIQEPEANDDTTADDADGEAADDKNIEIPEKFKNKDGSLNIEAFSKSFRDYEVKNTKLSQELAEVKKQAEQLAAVKTQQEEVAKLYGFDTVEAMDAYNKQVQQSTQLAQIEANEYAQYLKQCEYPNEVRNLLIQYAQNPSKELMESIEAEFPLGVIKQVAESMAVKKGQLAAQMQQAQLEQHKASVKNYLEDVIVKYEAEFKNPEFVSLFGEAFKALGAQLNADFFIEKLYGLKKSWIKEYEAQKAAQLENNEDIAKISSLGPNGTKATNAKYNVDLDKISDSKLNELVRELV
jgi:hypothetical protein